MDFKEFFELEEFGDNICSENIITSPLKFAGGMGGNLIGQNIRGAGNIIKGAYKGTKGIANSGIGALQAISGDKKGKERIKKGIEGILGGVKDAGKGIAQSFVSPISSVLRGAQAVDDDEISGILSPKSGNKFQKFLGLRGEKDNGKLSQVTSKANSSIKVNPPPVPPRIKVNPPPVPPRKVKNPKNKIKNSDFEQLINNIKVADGPKRRVLIQALKNKYPDIYNKIRSKNKKSRI